MRALADLRLLLLLFELLFGILCNGRAECMSHTELNRRLTIYRLIEKLFFFSLTLSNINLK